MIERDGLPAFRAGRQWRMRVSDLERWVDDRVRAAEREAVYAVGQAGLFAEPQEAISSSPKLGFGDSAFTENADLPVHRWVPWIAGFSATFVADALRHYLPQRNGSRRVLDPFAGVGTTLVTALLEGHSVCGFEINPYAAEATRLKLECHMIRADDLAAAIERFEREVPEAIRTHETPRSRPPRGFTTRKTFLSPAVERKVLLAHDFIGSLGDPLIRACFRVALAAELVGFSNYSYEPSLGTRAAAGKKDVLDAPVVAVLAAKLREMLADVRTVQERVRHWPAMPETQFHIGSFFDLNGALRDGSVDLVVTSPPYLNNYHYIRNSRPQMYWLGLASTPGDLRPVEEGSFGKFWQTVRDRELLPLDFALPELEADLAFLRTINTHKGIYGGAGWANYAAAYFNDCHRFAGVLRRVLARGARAVVVLGNSILQGIEFRTDRLFARTCEMQGLRTEGIVPLREKRTGTSIIASSVRTSAAKARTRLYESAVVLNNPP